MQIRADIFVRVLLEEGVDLKLISLSKNVLNLLSVRFRRIKTDAFYKNQVFEFDGKIRFMNLIRAFWHGVHNLPVFPLVPSKDLLVWAL